MRYYEKAGHWPLMKPKAKEVDDEAVERSSSEGGNGVVDNASEKQVDGQGAQASSNVREVPA